MQRVSTITKLYFPCCQPCVLPVGAACVYKNQTYELGESVPTSNPCRLCSCRQDFSTGLPSLSCISKECPHNFRPYPPGCYGIYVPERCCPVRTQCNGEEEAVATCELDGQTYQLGQKMYPRDSECQTCICTEDWDPVNRTGCSVVECLLETQLHYLRRGCVPVYHDKVCCPIDYHCPVSELRALDDSPTHNDSTKHGDDEEDEEDDDKSKPDLCVLPSVSGPCYALFTRFYFDTTLGRCSEFTYGGCRGNPNNFLTKERCEAVCQPGRRKKSLAPEHPGLSDSPLDTYNPTETYKHNQKYTVICFPLAYLFRNLFHSSSWHYSTCFIYLSLAYRLMASRISDFHDLLF
ncbi:hypothetical protein LAZ67_20002499 [Cordylochernes scorpioides]|uniref:BPTI/Kunitz inhibitor domain-containing protein n=1 Tax=Cordylochernes scorpioides TaxID=51811 RepID=A0ABY6LL42_9ARAC|nr:hypothetical protein LAZ67_20002499 [Cordylochernes scorpioides]